MAREIQAKKNRTPAESGFLANNDVFSGVTVRIGACVTARSFQTSILPIPIPMRVLTMPVIAVNAMSPQTMKNTLSICLSLFELTFWKLLLASGATMRVIKQGPPLIRIDAYQRQVASGFRYGKLSGLSD